MRSLFIKEISSFFSSLTGYLVIGVFLLLNSLFMWIVPGQFNVLSNGYATLDALFAISPWVFLFLVPAITMRMISEEKRTGTLDLLYTRPVTELQIILAKFLASWALVLLSLLPTLIYFWSVSRLGSPPGQHGHGGNMGFLHRPALPGGDLCSHRDLFLFPHREPDRGIHPVSLSFLSALPGI